MVFSVLRIFTRFTGIFRERSQKCEARRFLRILSGLRVAMRFDNIMRVRKFCEGLGINCLGLLILTILVDTNVVRLKIGKFPSNCGESSEFAACDQFSIPSVVYVAAPISLIRNCKASS